jgi:hypothetical protein
MVLALSTVSFIESFHGLLVGEGTAYVNDMSVNGSFLGHSSTSQWPSPLPRVSTVKRHCSFLCRSHAEQLAKHSANKHRGMPRGAAQRLIGLPVKSSQRAGLATRPRTRHYRVGCPSEGRPARQCLPRMFMFGYTGLNCQQPAIQTKVEAMQSSNVCTSFQAKAVQPTLPTCTSLTFRSTGTSMLRIAAR